MKNSSKTGIKSLNNNEVVQVLIIFQKAYLLSESISEKTPQMYLFSLGAAHTVVGKSQQGLMPHKVKVHRNSGERWWSLKLWLLMMKWNSKAAQYFGKALRAYKYSETQGIADALIRFGNCFMNTGDLFSALLELISHVYQKAKKVRWAVDRKGVKQVYDLEKGKKKSNKHKKPLK